MLYPSPQNLLVDLVSRFLLLLALVYCVSAHVAAWHKGMYCLNGTKPGVDDQNTNDIVMPLYQLTKKDWWFHHINHCDEFPPAPGDFLDLPNRGSFNVELAVNRAFTTLSYNGRNIGLFGDGQAHPELAGTHLTCITSPNIHTPNRTMAAGTAFAISYTSQLSSVTPENLAVFTVLYHTPWYRLATYQVPDLPACPEGGCICAWGWVPDGCGEPNMYMSPFRCRVTGATGIHPIAKAVPPVWCEDDRSKCVKGAKQMIFWHQLDGNNIQVSGLDRAGNNRSPAYNAKLGFSNGAQTDIFNTNVNVKPLWIPPSTPIQSGSEDTGALSGVLQYASWLLSVFFAVWCVL